MKIKIRNTGKLFYLIVVLTFVSSSGSAGDSGEDLTREPTSPEAFEVKGERLIDMVRVVTELVQPTRERLTSSMMIKTEIRESRSSEIPNTILSAQKLRVWEDDSLTYRSDYLENVMLVDDESLPETRLFEWTKEDLIRGGLPDNLTLAMTAMETWAELDAVEALQWLADTGTRDQRSELEGLVLPDLIKQKRERSRDYANLLVSPGELEYLRNRIIY